MVDATPTTQFPFGSLDESQAQASTVGGGVLGAMSSEVQSLSGIDEKVQSARTAQRGWSLPQLPDTVLFDVATAPGLITGAEVSEFMHGIRQDLSTATRPKIQTAQQPAGLEQTFGVDEPDDPMVWEIRKTYNGLAGLRAPKIVDESAASKLKQRMVDKGLLPADTPLDASWDPAFNSAYRDMLDGDARQRMGGERPGSVSFGRTMEVLEDWFSPTGLISAAVALDFLPDLDQVGNEFKSWGDKFGSWLKDPFDPGKFIDAATGPLDDILVPVVNTALLFSGVGNVWNTARLARYGAEGAKLWSGINYGGRFSRLAGFADEVMILDDIKRSQMPGLILGRSRKAERMLGPWRAKTNTIVAKKAVQQGMRLGLVGKLETVAFPNVAGMGFTDFMGQNDGLNQAERIDEYKRFRTSNPTLSMLSLVAELPLAPTNIFAGGKLLRAASYANETKNWALLTETERAEAVRSGLADGRRVSSDVFKTLHSGSRITSVFAQAHVAHLQDLVDSGRLTGDALDTARRNLNEIEDLIRSGESGKALKLAYGVSDDETAGAQSAYIAISAALDIEARGQVNLHLGTPMAEFEDPVLWSRRYLSARNQHIDQLRQWHLPETEEDWMETALDLAKAEASHHKNRKAVLEDRFAKRQAELFHADADVRATARESVLEELKHHNEMSVGHFNKLLDSVDDEVLADYYVRRTAGTVQNWDDYTALTDELEGLVASGTLNPQAFRAFDTEYGDMGGARLDEALKGSLTKVKRRGNSWADRVLKNQPDALRGRFTLQRTDQPTYQQLLSLRQHIQRLERDVKGFESVLEKHPGIVSKVIEPLTAATTTGGKKWTSLQNAEIEALIRGFDPEMTGGRARALRKTLKDLDARGYDLPRALDDMRADLRALDESPLWETLRIAPHRPLHNDGTVKGKLELLKDKLNVTAREVDVPSDVAERFAQQGYRIVYGVDFLEPSDLRDLPSLFGDLSRRTRRRQNFVSFFTRQGHQEANLLRTRRLRTELSKISQRDDVLGALRIDDPSAPEVDDLVHALEEYHRNLRTGMEQGIQDAATMWEKTTARARMQGVPFSIFDLQTKHVAEALRRWNFDSSEATAKAVVGALRRATDVGFERRGLVAIEDSLRANGSVLGGLRWLGKTTLADDLRKEAGFGKRALSVVRQAPQRGIMGVTGGMIASTAATQGGLTEPGDPTAGLAGLAAGAVLGPRGARALGAVGTKAGWADYGRLPDFLARERDRLRFGLSPFFDLSRYTEGMTLGQIAVPEGVVMPVNYNRARAGAWLKKKGLASDDTIKGIGREFNEAFGADFDWDNLESTVRMFRNEGIMGFNPTDWMAGAYTVMRAQGVDQAKAYEAAKTLFTYGTKGRSAAELSVNFVFFPFSFQKKLATHMAQFLATDLGRAVTIQDSYKAYEFLNERYDLNQRWEDHLPMLDQLRRLNSFAMGMNPGQLGGVNRIFIDAVNETPLGDVVDTAANTAVMVAPEAVQNFFGPQAVFVKDESDTLNLRRLMRRAIPLWNDAERLLENAHQQGEILTGGITRNEWLSSQAEVEQGYDRFNKLRDTFEGVARENGMNLRQFLAGEESASLKALFDEERSKIEKDLPAFGAARRRSAQNAVARDVELQQLVGQIQLDVAEGRQVGESEVALIEFMQFENEMKQYLEVAEISIDNEPELVPDEYFQLVQMRAAEIVRKYPQFARLWRRHFESTYGPVTMELT